jgi:hypothetical protein
VPASACERLEAEPPLVAPHRPSSSATAPMAAKVPSVALSAIHLTPRGSEVGATAPPLKFQGWSRKAVVIAEPPARSIASNSSGAAALRSSATSQRSSSDAAVEHGAAKAQ